MIWNSLSIFFMAEGPVLALWPRKSRLVVLKAQVAPPFVPCQAYTLGRASSRPPPWRGCRPKAALSLARLFTRRGPPPLLTVCAFTSWGHEPNFFTSRSRTTRAGRRVAAMTVEVNCTILRGQMTTDKVLVLSRKTLRPVARACLEQRATQAAPWPPRVWIRLAAAAPAACCLAVGVV